MQVFKIDHQYADLQNGSPQYGYLVEQPLTVIQDFLQKKITDVITLWS